MDGFTLGGDAFHVFDDPPRVHELLILLVVVYPRRHKAYQEQAHFENGLASSVIVDLKLFLH